MTKYYDIKLFEQNSFGDFRLLCMTVDYDSKYCEIKFSGAYIFLENCEARILNNVVVKICNWDIINIKIEDIDFSEYVKQYPDTDPILADVDEFVIEKNILILRGYGDAIEWQFTNPQIEIIGDYRDEDQDEPIYRSIIGYFSRLVIYLYDKYNEEYPLICLPSNPGNDLIVANYDNNGNYLWREVPKKPYKLKIIDFNELEDKYGIKIHNDIKNYYNQFCFYYMRGTIHEDQLNADVYLDMNRVVPGEEVANLDEAIKKYYANKDLNNINMIPLGLSSNQDSFIVVDNQTGVVYLDDKAIYPRLIKISDNIASLISRINP